MKPTVRIETNNYDLPNFSIFYRTVLNEYGSDTVSHNNCYLYP